MKIYLAGPMRGYENFNFPAFDFAANKLREEGHTIFSPADRDRNIHGQGLENNKTGDEAEAEKAVGFSLRDALADDIGWICHHADAIALLPGWTSSKGAMAEFATASALGLTQIILGKAYVR